MAQIGKREFLQHASKYLKKIEETGEEMVITHHNKPQLKLIPIEPKGIQSLKGLIKKFKKREDINKPIFPPFDKW